MSGSIPSGELAIQTRGLTKRFGTHVAVNDVDLAVPRGAVFGFLGPNGSGKTTTIRMMLGLAEATGGEIQVLGRDMPHELSEVLPRVGALVEGPAFAPFLSGTANLRRLDAADRFAPAATRTARIGAALDKVGLEHVAAKKVHAYSLGMKQRLGLANALLAPRELLVLDEPTNGLDPQGTREVRSLVRSLAGEGTTVFVSSHLLAEIEQMCTHAAVLSNGTLVAQGTLDELRSSGEATVRVRTPDAAQARTVLAGLGLAAIDSVAQSTESDALVSALFPGALLHDPSYRSDPVPPESIVAALVAGGVRVRGFAVESASLEDRFVALTGEGFDIEQ
ncbi:ABC transporter ATP-binding protein [Parafrigoribacterium mesophilum]|uniref:ABC transporter ATP-binding protein n=1 Tax=Parafrigoribacterium mesophilum TaxID=433646 RepID=UPI0031FCCBD2